MHTVSFSPSVQDIDSSWEIPLLSQITSQFVYTFIPLVPDMAQPDERTRFVYHHVKCHS